MKKLMSTPLVPELQTEEGKILSEMVQLLNYVCAAPTLNRQELATKLLGLSAKCMDTLHNLKLKLQSLEQQHTEVNEQPEDAKDACEDAESWDSLSTEEVNEEASETMVRTDISAKHTNILNKLERKLSSLEDQHTELNEELEDAQESVSDHDDDSEDSESCDSLSSVEEKEDATEMIVSSTSEYKVEAILGKGTFGIVTQCLKKPSNETVALKMIKDRTTIKAAIAEVKMLYSLKVLGCEQFNIVSCTDSFIFDGHFCIEFKKLDMSLIDYIETQESFQLREIRPVLQQLSTALWFLKVAGVVHTDLKPHNIMLVDRVHQPLKVQVIDFGGAICNLQERTGVNFQTLLYRSPEILLGAPSGCPIDMWSLGCIAAEMLTGTPLFDIYLESQLMQHIVFLIGQPPNKVLKLGLKTGYYFDKRNSTLETEDWVLKPLGPICARTSSTECPQGLHTRLHTILEVPVEIPEEDIQAVECDRLCFVDLVEKMLRVDASERITPEEMLSHPFITLSHLNHESHNSYVNTSIKSMKVCKNWSFEGGENAPPILELQTEEWKVLSEMVQLLNFIDVDPKIRQQKLPTKLLEVATMCMDTLHNSNLKKRKLSSLEDQHTEVNEELEDAQESVSDHDDDSEDSESCDSLSSEEKKEDATKMIVSSTSKYKVEAILGKGTFGIVTQCLKKPSNETVALKMIKDRTTIKAAIAEVKMLYSLKVLGCEQFNIVSCTDSFIFDGHFCIEFKKLDMSLIDYIETQESFQLREIRPVLQQLSTALWFLKVAGVVHADLKPHNIMLVDRVHQPLKVKIIDFGGAICDRQERTGVNFQTLLYRSPEILLGAPSGCPIDMWSLGCIAAEMLTGTPLFDIYHESQLMQHIVFLIGQPPNKVLKLGLKTGYYFNKRNSTLETEDWVLKSLGPICARISSTECPQGLHTRLHTILEVPVEIPEEDIQAVECDRLCFVDLVEKMLHVDASERITPEEMLSHPFITLSHLNHESHNSYVNTSIESMKVCKNWSFEGGENAPPILELQTEEWKVLSVMVQLLNFVYVASIQSQRQATKLLEVVRMCVDTLHNQELKVPSLSPDQHTEVNEELEDAQESVSDDSIECMKACFKGEKNAQQTISNTSNSETDMLTMDIPLNSEEELSVHEDFISFPEERRLEDLNCSEHVSRSPEQNEEETQSTTSDGTSPAIENTPTDSNATIQALIEEVTQLKAVIKEKDEKIKELERKEDYFVQYTRMNNLVISGLDLTHRTDAQTTTGDREGEAAPRGEPHTLQQQVINFFSSKGILIDSQNVAACYTLCQRRDGRSNIVISFVSRQHKDEVLKQSKKLKGTRVYVNEHLTVKNRNIASQARILKKQKRIQDTWTRNGKVMIRLNGTRGHARVISVRDIRELDRYKPRG